MTTETNVLLYSRESEMMVLGCMLTSIDALNSAGGILSNGDFYLPEHKLVFQVLKEAHQKGSPADVHIVAEELKRTDSLKSVGGVGYLMTLAQYAGTSAHLEAYVDLVKKKHMERELSHIPELIEKRARDKGEPDKTILELRETLNQIERLGGAKDKHPILFLNKRDVNFLTSAPPKKQMLLEYLNEKGVPIGFLPKGIVAMIVGAGGVGKTHLLAQLAIAISTGTPWLDIFTPTKCGDEHKGNVFLGLGENQYEDIHRVIYKASKKLRQKQPDLTKQDPLMDASARIAPFSFCGQQASFIEDKKPSVYFRQLKTKLIDMAPEGGWSLIILDPISRLMGAAAETDNAAATQFIALLEELTIDLPGNPTVLVAHHVTKAAIRDGNNQNQTAARGSSALTDGVRWQCNLIKDKDKNDILLKMEKTNFTAIVDPLHFQKDEEGCLQYKGMRETKIQSPPPHGRR